MHRRTLSKQSLWGQVIAKLTLEICINNASSNSRLTAVGRQATAADSHSHTWLQIFFFSLPTFEEKTTKPHLHAEKLTETVLHLNLGHFVGFFLVQFCSTLCFLFDETTTEQHQRHHLQDWRLRDKHQIINTETSLHLNLGFFIFYFLFCFIFIIYIFSFSLRLISTLMLPVYIFEILSVCFFVLFFFDLIICFSLFL
jgi:hypothetical protein